MSMRLLAILLLLALGVSLFHRAGAAPATPSPAERGRYLVETMGCGDCHTPLEMGPNGPEPDLDRYLSGHPQEIGTVPAPKLDETWPWAGTGTNTAFAGPWGVTYAVNLTPDRLSGLGIWTEDMFVRALETGKHWGQSRPIQPPMPWRSYKNLTEDDLRAIFAYLRTVRPIRNRPPDYQPPGPDEE